MESLIDFIKSNSVRKLLAVFPHPDDESFVAGGLFQILEELGVDTKLICLTKGERGKNYLKLGDLKEIRRNEFIEAANKLFIDDYEIYDFPDAELLKTKKEWVKLISDKIRDYQPDVILTFDYSGITGHPDHLVTCDQVLKLVKKLKTKPILIWRCPDDKEKNFFHKNEALKFASEPNLVCEYNLKKRIRKIKAIFSHKSQLKNFQFKLHVIDWFLFDHKEFYYKVDLDKVYKFKFVDYQID